MISFGTTSATPTTSRNGRFDGRPQVARGAAYADYDHDGVQDFAIVTYGQFEIFRGWAHGFDPAVASWLSSPPLNTEAVNAVAWIANSEDHHPDLAVGYSHCELRWWTHAVGGLTENDFICAAKIDALLDL